VQYASHTFRRLLNKHGIEASMSRKGDYWDNAFVESFFGSLKSERVPWQSYPTREEARADIVEYRTMCYSSHRLHRTRVISVRMNLEETAAWPIPLNKVSVFT
jgi:transposase InsO family protein